MGITAHTAETYRKNAALKLNVRTKPEMVRLVVLYGWK
jgi:DNA-binding CsgD family transcriptional regulator